MHTAESFEETESDWLQRLDRELDAVFNTTHVEEAAKIQARTRASISALLNRAGAGGDAAAAAAAAAAEAEAAPPTTVTKRANYRASVFQPSHAVTCSGWLDKKGKMLAGWQRRWFQVAGHYLTYRSSESETDLKASVDLANVTVDEVSAGSPIFHLRGSADGKVLMTLRASNGAEAELWAGAMREVIRPAQNQFQGHRKLSKPTRA